MKLGTMHTKYETLGTLERLFSDEVQTPAYIFSEKNLLVELERARSLADKTGCHLVYSLKSLGYLTVLEKMLGIVEGFSASSLFEAKMAAELLDDSGSVHYVTPGLRDSEIPELAELCDYITLNSINHWQRLAPTLRGQVHVGIRINPEVSVAQDPRYDPCAPGSRLGMHIPEFLLHARKRPDLLSTINGIHMHTNCEGEDFQDLWLTVRKITDSMGHVLEDMEWFNLGGGYFFDRVRNLADFERAVGLLRKRYGLRVFMEPGGAIVRSSGYIVATILDIVGPASGKIAVLDTSVNHMPEVFEYQYRPELVSLCTGDTEKQAWRYTLAGASCLSGDVFGTYSFAAPLKIGQRLIFKNMGSYTLVKAHMFNGINLPSIYFLDKEGRLNLERRFTYGDYLNAKMPDYFRVAPFALQKAAAEERALVE